jgi:hypothetical protein
VRYDFPCVAARIVFVTGSTGTLGGAISATRDDARRLGLVTRAQMTRALAAAVETPPDGAVRVLDVPAIRAA